MAFRARERGVNTSFTPEEIGSSSVLVLGLHARNSNQCSSYTDSVMANASPGAPQLSVLSFTSGFHGRLFGSLSATRSKPIHKVRPNGVHIMPRQNTC